MKKLISTCFVLAVASLAFFSISFADSLASLKPTAHPLKIGIYTGTFDPPHIGHYELMQHALDAGLDYVIMIPNGRMAHKPNASSFEVRLTMSQIMTTNNPRILVPAKQDDPALIIENTISEVLKLAPKADIVGIIGSDVADLMSGRVPGYIEEQNASWTNRIDKWLVDGRTPEYSAPRSVLGKPVTYSISNNSADHSSTEIREALRHNNLSVLEKLVGKHLSKWILSHSL